MGTEIFPRPIDNPNRPLVNIRRGTGEEVDDIVVPEVDFEAVPRASDEAKAIYYDLLKPSRNKLLSYFIGKLAGKVSSQRLQLPPFGLKEVDLHNPQIPEEEDIMARDYTNDFAVGSINVWTDEVTKWNRPLREWAKGIPDSDLLHLSKESFSQEERNYAKLKYTTDLPYNIMRVGRCLDILIRGGAGTAGLVTPLAVKLGAEVAIRDAGDQKPEEVLATMEDVDRLYPLTAWLASLHLTHGPSLFNSMLIGYDNRPVSFDGTMILKLPIPGDDEFYKVRIDPDLFKDMTLRNGKKVLAPSSDLKHLKNPAGEVILDKQPATVRSKCPALPAMTQSFESDKEVDVVRYQLEWAMDVAKVVLFPETLKELQSH